MYLTTQCVSVMGQLVCTVQEYRGPGNEPELVCASYFDWDPGSDDPISSCLETIAEWLYGEANSRRDSRSELPRTPYQL